MKKIAFIFGTRPEVIKIAPVIKRFIGSGRYKVIAISTGQHKQMLEQITSTFNLKVNYNLDLMKENQDITELTSRVLMGLKDVLLKEKPDLVFVQGDTTTTMAGSLASFYQKIPIAHIEAGLRTWNKYFPFPEEVNRKISSVIADFHFAPTELAKNNLLKSGIDKKNVEVTGNTVIDSLFYIKDNIESFDNLMEIKKIVSENASKKIILITGHRRENFGQGFENICFALKKIAQNNPNIVIIYPVHLNPNVQKPVNKILSGINNILLIKPLEYEPFIYLMINAYIILTDSGGVQEEAPSLGKPVLVMRNETERPEAIDAGVVKLVGTNIEKIVQETERLLNDKELYMKQSMKKNPFGDGKSSDKIFTLIDNYFATKKYEI